MDFDLEPVVTKSKVSIKLFRNVKNVPELRENLINGTLECCIIKPSLIIDPFQIVVAANKALIAEKLTTKTIFSEILFNLSISKNITQSLQKFGIHDDESDILVVVINPPSEVFSKIQGDEVDLSELNVLQNLAAIKKAYKLSDIEMKENILNSVVSRIATKDFVSY